MDKVRQNKDNPATHHASEQNSAQDEKSNINLAKSKINRRLILKLMSFIILAALLFSAYKIVFYYLEISNTDTQIKNLIEIASIEEITDEREIDSGSSSEAQSETSLHQKYLNTPLLSVDLQSLKQKNSDTIGWLQILGANINCPIVQTDDNRFYLFHSFDKSYNSAGWPFLDYNNPTDLSDKNNIIYVHGRLEHTLFNSFNNLSSSAWINSPENYLIRIATENTSSVWQVFSIYIIPAISDYLQTTFKSDSDFAKFLDLLSTRSDHDFSTAVTAQDNILTISIRYDDTKNLIIHAKFFK